MMNTELIEILKEVKDLIGTQEIKECWMHEWAKAYRQIGIAEQHIERALEKMKFRKDRFPGKAKQYELAYHLNDLIIKNLQQIRRVLHLLIDIYGIKPGGEYSPTLKKLMEIPKLKPAKEWAEKY
jgi:hypothetical protein